MYTNENASAAVFEHKSKGGKETGSAIFFAMMPIFLEDEEFKEYYDKLYDQFVAGFTDSMATEEAIFKICDNVYRRIEYPNACGTSKVKFEEPATGSIRQISEYARRQGTYSPTDVLYGVFKIVKPGVTPKKKKAVISVKDFAGKYKLSECEFNEKEQLYSTKEA